MLSTPSTSFRAHYQALVASGAIEADPAQAQAADAFACLEERLASYKPIRKQGLLGRLFAETIENMDMAPIDALALTGANRMQVFSHGVVPMVLPALLGIGLYRLDENIRSSLVLGFVGAGGIGFELLTAMNLFQYREVSLLLIVIFVIVFAAERLSAVCRQRLS